MPFFVDLWGSMLSFQRVLPGIGNGIVAYSRGSVYVVFLTRVVAVRCYATKTPEQMEKIANYQVNKAKYRENVLSVLELHG